MKNKDLEIIAKYLNYKTTVVNEQVYLVYDDTKQIYNPFINTQQFNEILDKFEWITLEHPGQSTWVVYTRLDLQEPELVVVVSNKSRQDGILNAMLKTANGEFAK